MWRIGKPVGAAALVLAIALAGPGCTIDDDGTQPPQPPPPCPDGGLRVSFGAGDGASGLRVTTLQVVNCATSSYALAGYPELRLLDAARAPLPVEVVRGSGIVEDPGPSPLTLAPGASATAALSWRNLTEVGRTAITATSVEVTVADGVAPQVLEESVDLGTTGRVEVTAWAPVR